MDQNKSIMGVSHAKHFVVCTAHTQNTLLMLIDIELTICHMICTVLLYTHMRTINVIDPHHCTCGYTYALQYSTASLPWPNPYACTAQPMQVLALFPGHLPLH